MKNETTSKGDVYLEGSQKQLKNMLKNYILVKPGCLFDSTVVMMAKIFYMTASGVYSDVRSRTI